MTSIVCSPEGTNNLVFNNNFNKAYGAVRNKLKMNRKITWSKRVESISGKSVSHMTEQWVQFNLRAHLELVLCKDLKAHYKISWPFTLNKRRKNINNHEVSSTFIKSWPIALLFM